MYNVYRRYLYLQSDLIIQSVIRHNNNIIKNVYSIYMKLYNLCRSIQITIDVHLDGAYRQYETTEPIGTKFLAQIP